MWLTTPKPSDRRHLNLIVRIIRVESDYGAIGARNEKVSYKDLDVFGVEAAKLPRNMATFMVVTSRYGLTSNSDDA